MNFFFDNCLSWRLAKGLQPAAELEGVTLDHVHWRYPGQENVSDETWMTALGREGGWTAFTWDYGIQQTRQRLKLYRGLELNVFFVRERFARNPPMQQIACLAKNWSRVVGVAKKMRSGDLWYINSNGTPEQR